jgi:hypothetical protein
MAIKKYTEQDLITFAASVNRILLAKALGQHTAYEGERDYYEAFGYNPSPAVEDYVDRYRRQDIAARIIDLPANDTWKKPPEVSEDDNMETAFVKEWESLATRLRIWSMLSRVDKLSGVGRYGMLLVGARDGENLAEPINQGSLKGEKGILYLRPFSEEKASIKTWVEDTGDERYGLPELYAVRLRDDKDAVNVHHTRVLHVAEGKQDTEIYGTPRLQKVYNRLDDLMKIVGGSAEATWLNMRPGTLLTNQPDYAIPQDDDAKEARLEEIRRYAHDPLRFLMLEGMDARQVGPSEVVDPSGPFNVQISLIAAACEIPQRVLLGSARGELAAAREDMNQWAGVIASRQSNYAEPEILRPFIDRLIWYGVLPMPANGYDIGSLDDSGVRRWPPLLEMSELEQAEITQKKALATRALVNPLTGQAPLDEGEQRELLGYPAEREEEMIGEEPVMQMLAAAAGNYRAGSVEAEALARYAFAVGMEALGEQ